MTPVRLPVDTSEKVQRLLQSVFENGPPGSHLNASQHEAWEDLTSVQFPAWRQDPGLLADEGIEAPKLDAIELAIEVAGALRERGIEPPLRTLPNGEGGMQFEWREAPYLWSLEVEASGLLTLAVFKDGRFVSRHQIG